MPITLNGTTGIQNVLGSASAPAESNTTSSNTGLYFPSSTTLGLATNGTAALTIDASQNVGVGTTSPSTKLQVNGQIRAGTNNSGFVLTDNTSTAFQFANCNTSNNLELSAGGSGSAFIFYNNAGNERMRIDSSGNLLVGTTSSPSNARFRAYGNASADFNFGPQTASGNNAFIVYNQSNVGVYLVSGNTSWTATSDERKKDIIEPITDAANKVSNIRAVIGKYKTDEEGTRRSFLIAQDIQSVLPEAVDATDPDNLGVSYTDVIPLLVAAITELKAELDALKGTVDAQAAEIAALKAKAPA